MALISLVSIEATSPSRSRKSSLPFDLGIGVTTVYYWNATVLLKHILLTVILHKHWRCVNVVNETSTSWNVVTHIRLRLGGIVWLAPWRMSWFWVSTNISMLRLSELDHCRLSSFNNASCCLVFVVTSEMLLFECRMLVPLARVLNTLCSSSEVDHSVRLVRIH
jgi:hypothetical protein